ncbi:MAG TPA: glycosyltransferase family 39 protein [Thermodesulfobacteriota bacterium]|nr:glycosyltransferase family 39 protein [Thermodesulfobacteriota bacterium]
MNAATTPKTSHPDFDILERPQKKKKNRWPAWLFLLLFTMSTGIVSIFGHELSIHDSARVAGIAREMAFTGNYFIPKLNGQNFLEYPSLGYLPIALFLSTSNNPPDFLAILPVVLFGTATVLLTFLIGKVLANERVGLIAGFILATMFGFFILHRRCLVDPTLLFFTVLSLYGFAVGYQAPSKRFRFLAIFYLAMAGGFLSKGLIGVAIPAGTALIFLVVRRDFAGIRRLYLGRGVFLFLLPIGLWMAGVWWLEGPDLIKEVVRQSLWRFLSSSADHPEPFYFYFIPFLLNTLPWTPLPLVWLWYRRTNPRPEKSSSPDLLALFALVWFLTVFVGLSIASAKRTLYIAPLYPPSALLAAFAWTRLCEKFQKVKRFETYGIITLFSVYVAVNFTILLPSEKKDSFRPVFEVVRNQQVHGPVYLCGGSESLEGAAVFYLGKIVPVRSRNDLMQEKFEAPSGTILIIPFFPGDEQLLANLPTKGFRLLAEKTVRKISLRIYSNSP